MVRFFTAERRRSATHWLAELGIVVAGVLIALYAQQWDSDRSARQREAEASERIRQEIVANVYNLAERLALHACLRDRLGTIATKLKRGGSDWEDFAYPSRDTQLSALSRIYRSPSRNYTSAAFDGAMASGALDPMDPERQGGIASIYRQIDKVAVMAREEYGLASQLDSLQIGGPIGSAERGRMLGVVSLLDRYNGLNAVIARQVIARIKPIGIWPTPKEMREYRQYVSSTDRSLAGGSVHSLRESYGECVDPTGFDLEKIAAGTKEF